MFKDFRLSCSFKTQSLNPTTDFEFNNSTQMLETGLADSVPASARCSVGKKDWFCSDVAF